DFLDILGGVAKAFELLLGILNIQLAGDASTDRCSPNCGRNHGTDLQGALKGTRQAGPQGAASPPTDLISRSLEIGTAQLTLEILTKSLSCGNYSHVGLVNGCAACHFCLPL